MKKLSLKNLQVKSFVTKFKKTTTNTLKGGSPEASQPQGPCEQDHEDTGITYPGCCY